MSSEQRTEDEGFTLIEVLIATMITSIILTVLVASFLVFFKNASYISGRDDHAAGASVLAAWLDRDLASATAKAPTTVPANCTTAKAVLSLSWTDYKAGAAADDPPITDTNWRVEYQYLTDSFNSNRCMIRRVLFKGGTAQAPQDLVHDLSSVDLATQASGAANQCPSADTPLTLTLARYHTTTDSDADVPYTYFGCIKARTNGL